jgi:enoyl-CoA hydratase/carnithine racemase
MPPRKDRSMSDYREIRYEVEEQIGTITFNRPEQRNPISVGMLDEVASAVRAAQQDDAVRVLVITGAGRAFCSGGDVKSMAQVARAGGGAVSVRQEQLGLIQETQLLLRRFPKVLIAAVNGAAYGAGPRPGLRRRLSLGCRHRPVLRGLRAVGAGPGRRRSLASTADRGADQRARDDPERRAHRRGDRALHRTGESRGAGRSAARGHPGLREAVRAVRPPRGEVAKRTVLRGLEMSFEAALDFIRPQIGVLRATEDHKEGLRALQERRLPRFEGR